VLTIVATYTNMRAAELLLLEDGKVVQCPGETKHDTWHDGAIILLREERIVGSCARDARDVIINLLIKVLSTGGTDARA
jgi:hypothetical protein